MTRRICWPYLARLETVLPMDCITDSIAESRARILHRYWPRLQHQLSRSLHTDSLIFPLSTSAFSPCAAADSVPLPLLQSLRPSPDPRDGCVGVACPPLSFSCVVYHTLSPPLLERRPDVQKEQLRMHGKVRVLSWLNLQYCPTLYNTNTTHYNYRTPNIYHEFSESWSIHPMTVNLWKVDTLEVNSFDVAVSSMIPACRSSHSASGSMIVPSES